MPFVSVVVPARNEEKTLPDLLNSLSKSDYPADRMEIIIVNDQSEDRTREIAESFAESFQCSFLVIDVDDNDTHLRAKTRPLAQGLDITRGEIILTTDADCTVSPTWIRSVVSYFAADVGMVCGTTLPRSRGGKNGPLRWFEMIDWLYLLGVSTAFSGLRIPQALIGNNFSIRKQTYEQLGTYRALSFNSIEDLSLLQAVKNTGKWKVVYPADRGLLIETRPLESFRQLIVQRRRWGRGWHNIELPGKLVLSYGGVISVVWPFFAMIFGEKFILPYIFIVLGDFSIVARMTAAYQKLGSLLLTPFYPVYRAVYGVLIALHKLLRRRIIWKERQY